MTDGSGFPPVAEIVAGLHEALGRERPVAPGRLGSLLSELHRSNVRQWDLEDVTRAPDAGDSVVAGAKRAIDELNLNRHRLIEAIDAAVQDHLTQSATATPATETPGMVLDRLSVLVIRIARTAEVAASDAPRAAECAARLPSLQGQLDALSVALEALVQDVRDGTRRFLPYEQLKLYSPRADQPASDLRLSRSGGGDSHPG